VEAENTRPVVQPDRKQPEPRQATVDRLTGEIGEARTVSLSLYVVAERGDCAPVRISGRRFALSGEKVFSTNDRKEAQAVADKLNAHYQANRIDRHLEVVATLAWRAHRVERLVELLASAELAKG
jgi:hypothetical protein